MIRDVLIQKYRKAGWDLHQTYPYRSINPLSIPFSNPSIDLDAVLVVVQHTTSNGCAAASTEVLRRSVSNIDTPKNNTNIHTLLRNYSTVSNMSGRKKGTWHISMYYIIYIYIHVLLYFNSSVQPIEFAQLHRSPALLGCCIQLLLSCQERTDLSGSGSMGISIWVHSSPMMHPSTCQVLLVWQYVTATMNCSE